MSNANIAEWGIHKLAFAPVIKSGGVIVGFGKPVMHPGAINLNVTPSDNADNVLSADDGRYYGGNGSKTKTGELNVALFNSWFRTTILGEIEEGGGIGEGDGEGTEFAMLWETNADQGGTRNVWYDCTSSQISKTFATTTYDGTVTYATETATITSTLVELPNGNKRRKWSCEKGSANYDTFFDEVYYPGAGTISTPELLGLTIGSLTLDPTFDEDTKTYATTTTNTKDAITAIPESGAAVTIKVGTTEIENGGEATWGTGDNTVEVTVKESGRTSTYTVTVTKS